MRHFLTIFAIGRGFGFDFYFFLSDIKPRASTEFFFTAKLCPKMTKRSLKKIKNPELSDGVSTKMACQVRSDSKLNVERDSHIHFA